MDQKIGLSRGWFRAFSLLLAFLQAFNLFAMQSGNASSAQPDAHSQRVMNEVKKVPIGGKLTVRKMDGTEYHGHLQSVTSQDFTLEEVDLKQTMTLSYNDVEQVSRNYGGKGIGGKRVNPKRSLIVGGVIIGVLVAVLAVALAKDKS